MKGGNGTGNSKGQSWGSTSSRVEGRAKKTESKLGVTQTAVEASKNGAHRVPGGKKIFRGRGEGTLVQKKTRQSFEKAPLLWGSQGGKGLQRGGR